MADIRIKDLATTATTTASDDFMAVDGVTNGTRKLSANAPSFLGNITSGGVIADQGGTIAAQRNGLAPRQGLNFDGTAWPTLSIPAFGTSDFSVSIRANVPTLGNYALFGGNNNSFGFLILTNGTIRTGLANVGDNTASTGAITAGRTYVLSYVRSSTTGTYYIDGVAAGTTTDSRNYSAVIAEIGHSTGGFGITGSLLDPLILNRALSAAEVLALYQTGAVAAGDINNASNTSKITGDGWYSTYAGSSVSGGTITLPNNSLVYNSTALKIGSKYLVTLTVSALTGPLFAGDGLTYQTFTTTGAKSYEWTARQTQFQIVAPDGSTGTVTGVSLTNLGALLAPDSNNAGAGLEWLDVSGNRAHIVLPTSGVSWSLPSSQQIVIEASTSTNGNQQLGGASLIDANKQWRIQSWTVNCSTGTPTISLGNVSAGTQYNAASVLAAGNNDITLVTRFPSTANLWVNSSTTATLIHRITLVPAN